MRSFRTQGARAYRRLREASVFLLFFFALLFSAVHVAAHSHDHFFVRPQSEASSSDHAFFSNDIPGRLIAILPGKENFGEVLLSTVPAIEPIESVSLSPVRPGSSRAPPRRLA